MKLFYSLVAACLVATTAARSFGLQHRLIRSPTHVSSTPVTVRIDKSPRLFVRGGAKKDPCDDTDKMILAKAMVSAAMETAGLLGVLKLGRVLSSKLQGKVPFLTRLVRGLPVIEWASIVFVVFSSPTVKSWMDGTTSVATKQVLQPNVTPGNTEWYKSLKKPWFNPPAWVFPIMWVLIAKPTQSLALSKLLSSPTAPWKQLTVYCAHLALGDAWNQIFFGCQRIHLGGYVISAFYAMLLTSSALFGDLNEQAGYLMLPTCGWVTVATALNWSIYRLNASS